MLVDILLVVFLLTSFLRGRELGLIRQIFSTVGFIGGLFLGAWLQPFVIHFASTAGSRAILATVTTLAVALISLAILESIGLVIKLRLEGKKLNHTDMRAGAVAGSLTMLLTVWLSLPVLRQLPISGLEGSLQTSFIVHELDVKLPPAPGVITKLGRLIYPNGFPRVFIGQEPTPNTTTPLPNLGSLQAGVLKDRASVVKILGHGCGGVVEGSGFIAAKTAAGTFVATNAHVVAGIASPTVNDADGAHGATPVWFDYNLDLAVLRVDGNLAAPALAVNTATAPVGTPSAALGYPGGGDFVPAAASVLDSFIATGRNIYDQGRTERRVYSIKATIIPGNSGGPLINEDGDVIGLVFATSTTYDQVGYALNIAQVNSEVSQAVSRNYTVGTGQCASE